MYTFTCFLLCVFFSEPALENNSNAANEPGAVGGSNEEEVKKKKKKKKKKAASEDTVAEYLHPLTNPTGEESSQHSWYLIVYCCVPCRLMCAAKVCLSS